MLCFWLYKLSPATIDSHFRDLVQSGVAPHEKTGLADWNIPVRVLLLLQIYDQLRSVHTTRA